MSNASETVSLLRLIRHDWLNDLQLIKANLDLNRVNRASEIIDSIIMRAKNEAELSNLDAPQFATLLLTYNLEKKPVVLEFEVIGRKSNLNQYDEKLYIVFREIFDYLNKMTNTLTESSMSLMIENKAEGVTFSLDFAGQLEDTEDAKNYFMTLASHHSLVFDTHYIHNEEVLLAFSIHHN